MFTDAIKTYSGVIQVVEISNISSSKIKCSLHKFWTFFLIAHPIIQNITKLKTNYSKLLIPGGPQSYNPATPPYISLPREKK